MNTVQCTVSGKLCTVQQVIDFPQYNMKCRAKKVNPRGIFHGVSRFPPHILLYRGNLGSVTFSSLIKRISADHTPPLPG